MALALTPSQNRARASPPRAHSRTQSARTCCQNTLVPESPCTRICGCLMDAYTPTLTLSTLRSSLDNPTVKAEYSDNADDYITILHPGYNDQSKQSVLLRLQVFDRDGGGLDFWTALAACRIVAGSNENGFFKHQRDGHKINVQHDELLRQKIYCFYNPDVENEVYPGYIVFHRLELLATMICALNGQA